VSTAGHMLGGTSQRPSQPEQQRVQARVCAWLLNQECLGAAHLQPDQDGNSPAVMARLEGFHALADSLDAALAALLGDRRCSCCGAACGDEIRPASRVGEVCHCRCNADEQGQYGPFQMPDGLQGAAPGGVAAAGCLRKGSSQSERGACVRAAQLRQLSVRILRGLRVSSIHKGSTRPSLRGFGCVGLHT
jgi:hypothetical protein